MTDLDAIFDIEAEKCSHSHNPSGRPTGKHYSDYDIFLMKQQIQSLIDEARLEEHQALTPYVRDQQTIEAINFRTSIIRRSMDKRTEANE